MTVLKAGPPPSEALRDTHPRRYSQIFTLLALFLVFIFLYRGSLSGPSEPGVLLELSGETPYPGIYLSGSAGLREALVKTGISHLAVSDCGPSGVYFFGGSFSCGPLSRPLLFGRKIDVNTADISSLISIPGIGPVKAKAIALYRSEAGPFLDLSELKMVRGIGEKSLGQMLPFVEDPPSQ